MGNILAPDYRYNPFDQSFSSFGHGYSGNPKEVHIIPSVAPYFIYLNEIPRDDTISTLLVNEQGGSSFTEVSFSTPPAAGQFRAVYGGDETQPISIIGQGTIEFNSVDAGKIMEFAYYGMGAILQNQIFNKLLDGFYGVPDFANGLTGDLIGDVIGNLTGIVNADTINEKTSNAGVTIDSVLLKDNTVNSNEVITPDIYKIKFTRNLSSSTSHTEDFDFETFDQQVIIQIKARISISGSGVTNYAYATGILSQSPAYTGSPTAQWTLLSSYKTAEITTFTISALDSNTLRVQFGYGSNGSGRVVASSLSIGAPSGPF